MKVEEFDKKFTDLFTEMVEIAFDYVDRNEEEVDMVYVYGVMEQEIFYFDAFYIINNQLVQNHQINTVSKQQYDISDERILAKLDAGLDCLKRAQTLFKEEGQEVPTLLKMTFNAKTKAFNNEIIYELQFTNHSDKLPDDGADEWFSEIKDSMN